MQSTAPCPLPRTFLSQRSHHCSHSWHCNAEACQQKTYDCSQNRQRTPLLVVLSETNLTSKHAKRLGGATLCRDTTVALHAPRMENSTSRRVIGSNTVTAVWPPCWAATAAPLASTPAAQCRRVNIYHQPSRQRLLLCAVALHGQSLSISCCRDHCSSVPPLLHFGTLAQVYKHLGVVLLLLGHPWGTTLSSLQAAAAPGELAAAGTRCWHSRDRQSAAVAALGK
jgi:hypothetical protein